jgi:hypothetical protein
VRQTLKQVQFAVPAARFTRGSTKYQHTAVKEKLDKLKALESAILSFNTSQLENIPSISACRPMSYQEDGAKVGSMGWAIIIRVHCSVNLA